MDEPRFEFLYEISAELDASHTIGDTPQGKRQITVFRSGRFEGPKLKGEVLPGGGDWLLLRPDGAGELNVRATLQTDDDALIYLTYSGIFDAPPEVFARIVQGQQVPRDQYYWYTVPFFQTSAEKYAWLNKVIAIGVGYAIPGGIKHRVFALI